MKTPAAIRRASKQARNAMYELDRATSAELRTDYQRAADAVRAAIAQATGPDDLVRREHLQGLLRQIEDILQRMGLARDAVLTGALEQAATLGVRPYTLQGVGAVGGSTAVLDSAAAMRISEAAVEFVASFRMADGLALSDRLWRLDLGAKEVLQRAVSNAVAQGWSASKAVVDLMYGGKPVPPELAATLGRARQGALLNLADLLTGGEKGADGSELWKAERVMRTEINRAHGEAYAESAQRTPGFAGFRYLLSPRHPEPDICDLLASQNLHGLGPGVYPDRERTPWPAHPNTLSFLEVVFADEVTDADRAGKETELQALQRLGPAVRQGVLGVTKAAYFDQGLLRRGMLRSPLRAVEARLKRQGAPLVPKVAVLPNVARAVIPIPKVFDYMLNVNHPRGAHKAKVFASALGFTVANGDLLIAAIRSQAQTAKAEVVAHTPYGTTYRVDMDVTGPGGTAMVRTGWIVDPETGIARLTSAYVK